MAKQNGVKERLKQADTIINMLEEYKKYVSTLNECAYSDSMLRNAQECLNKLYDNGFTNKTIRSAIFVTDGLIEDLNDTLAGQFKPVTKRYIIRNFDRIINPSENKSSLDCCIQDYFGSCLSYQSKINK